MKRNFRILLAAVVVIGTASDAKAQQYFWSNFAGQPGSSGGGDATGSASQFNAPYATALDSAGNVYVADSNNHTIRKITVSGTSWSVTTLAGSAGVSGTANGTGSTARFNIPTGVAVDNSGNVYVADSGNLTIRMVTQGGAVTTLAGTPGQSGFADGPHDVAIFGCPSGVAVDSTGNVYVSDALNHVIRKVTSGGVVTTIAGTPGQPGYANGPGSAALFNTPTGVAVDGPGNVYVADNLNHVIRKISSAGTVTTLAGTPILLGTFDGTGSGAMFNYPAGVAVDSSGNVYVADTCNHTVRKITAAGAVTTLAGTVINATSSYMATSGSPGFKDGVGSASMFYYPYGIGVDGSGNVYVADTFNNAIRKVTPTGFVTTIAGSPSHPGTASGTGTGAQLNNPSGITVDSGSNLYVVDTYAFTFRKITPTAVVSQPAGQSGNSGSADGVGTNTTFNYPYGAAADSNGNVYVADTRNNTIRQIAMSGSTVVTISGSPGLPGSSDGAGSAALYSNPTGIAVDRSGNVYVADTYNNTIRKLTLSGTNAVATTIVGSPGVSGTSDGAGSAALFSYPAGVAVDSSTNIYVADSSNYTIRKITLSGSNWVSTTLAGIPGVSGSADGAGNAALFVYPTGIAVDSSSNVYVADSVNCTIRRITAAGFVTTIGGTPGVAGSANGAGGAGLFAYPYALTVDSSGNLFVADSGNNRISMGSCVSSGTVSGVTGAGATLNGLVNPEGASSTNAYFRYGTTTAYTSGTTTTQIIASGTSFVPITATLSGLSANTTYHFQLVVVTSNGTFYGTDQTFVTLPTAIPSITSAATATGTNGQPFSYQITANNSPTLYGASPLPGGLVVDPQTGQIFGTPTAASTTSVVLSASNVVGAGVKTLTLSVVNFLPPSITSGTVAGGVLGSMFVYQTTATNSPSSFIATGLPAGLSVNSSTGNISGIPTVTGTFSVTIGAVNSSATTTELLLLTVSPAYFWSNLAGRPAVTGTVNGTGTNAKFFKPYAVTADSSDNTYVADTTNNVIRKVTPGGVVTTLAGKPGTSGTADGTGGTARFSSPKGIAIDSGSNLYVADSNNCTIRKVTPAGVVTTLAGMPATSGSADGTGNTARFSFPCGIAVDSGSNIYVADTTNETIRKVTQAGVVTTMAGTAGSSGATDGAGSAARFSNPEGLAVDSGSNIYAADTYNQTIRKITAAGVVSTIAGTVGIPGVTNGMAGQAMFQYPAGVAIDGNGSLYVVDSNNGNIRKILISGTGLMVTTIGGTPGSTGTSDGLGGAAQFLYPMGIAVDRDGNVYIADTNNDRISRGVLLPPPVITSTLTAVAVTGSPFSYQITAANGPTSYNATGLPSGLTVNTSNGAISGTATTVGAFGATISAVNLGGTGTATLAVTVLSPYAFWQTQNFTPADLLDPTISGDMAAPAGDDIPNIIKYALHLVPKVNTANGLPIGGWLQQGGNYYLTLTYNQLITAPDIVYTVEVCGDMLTWNSGPGYTAYVSGTNNADGVTQTIVVQDMTPTSAATRRFIHLKITKP